MYSNVIIIALVVLLVESKQEDYFKWIKEKAKSYYRTKYSKNPLQNLLGYDVTEYPYGNEENKKIQKEKWEIYYRCLKEQNDRFGTHGSAIPDAVLGFEGKSFRFECKVCISPLEISKQDSVEWFWASKTTKKLEPIDYTEHVFLSPEDKTLIIYNLEMSQTGQYVCFLGKTGLAPYFLTVIESSDNLKEVQPDEAKEGPFAKPPEKLAKHNFFLYTEWSDWSPCSKCGKVGKKIKIGYCKIISADYLEISKTEEIQNNSTEIKESEFDELFTIFQNGIPCQSHILPLNIKYLDQVLDRKNEVMISYCKKPCEKDVFEVKDNKGNVIETANNSAGIYSMLQGLPSAEPDVERRLTYVGTGERVELSCPGNLNSDALMQWQINSKVLIPEIIATETHNRILISVMDKIIFREVHLIDSNVYSCWQNGDLAGTIRLVVEDKIKLNFNQHVTLFGVAVILLSFLYVYWKAFLGRHLTQS